MKNSDNLEMLASWLIGEYKGRERATEDSNQVETRVLVMPIWQTDKSGYWLYIEHAVKELLNQPFRQQVYRLRDINNELIELEIYGIRNATDAIVGESAKWKDRITQKDVLIRSGCAIILRRDGITFAGSTLGEGCVSQVNDMLYTTSQVVVNRTDFRVWTRRFSRTAGNQLSGKTIGGYTYQKVRNIE